MIKLNGDGNGVESSVKTFNRPKVKAERKVAAKRKGGTVSTFDPAAFVREARREIEGRLDEWRSLEGRANTALWRALGRIYEVSETFSNDADAKRALISEVQAIPEVQKSNRWHADKKTAPDLVLTLILGLKNETKATKSQWLAALRAAKTAGIEPTEAAFASWIGGTGGVVAARKAIKGKDAAGSHLSSPFNITKFIQSLPKRTTDAPLIHMDLGHLGEHSAGLSVALIHRSGSIDRDSEIRLIGTIGHLDIVTKVAAAIDGGRTAAESFEADCLWALNRFALKAAGAPSKPSGKVSFSDQMGFMTAIRKLRSEPILHAKFFDAPPEYTAIIPDEQPKPKVKGKGVQKTDPFSFDIKNPNYHPYDPGRYIEGAKPLVLVPYELNITDDGVTDAAVEKYVSERRKKLPETHYSDPMYTFGDNDD